MMRGAPKRIQVDNGSEFISKALDLWAYENNVTLDFSRPGKPTDNPFIEAFNGSLRRDLAPPVSLDSRLATTWGPERKGRNGPEAEGEESDGRS